jgi:hypothetical protein
MSNQLQQRATNYKDHREAFSVVSLLGFSTAQEPIPPYCSYSFAPK